MSTSMAISLSACNGAGGSASSPTPSPTPSAKYVYFTNFSQNVNTYTQCSVGSNGIESTTCVTTIPVSPGVVTRPGGIAFN